MSKRKNVTDPSQRHKLAFSDIIGEHPLASRHPFGSLVSATDGVTISGIPHRAIIEQDGQRTSLVDHVRGAIIQHHLSPEALERDRQRKEALQRLGLQINLSCMKRFPTNPKTQKGNLAEIFLAEYIIASSGSSLPIYRLRYNPNVDQAMKGDDVLAFDLDANPVRIVVGESKFRASSSKPAVIGIVKGLLRSHRGGVPTSLLFVADRLYETGNAELGAKVMKCAELFAIGKLNLDYVGFLMGDSNSARRVNEHTEASLRRLVMLSFSIDYPNSIVDLCYDKLEEIYGNPT